MSSQSQVSPSGWARPAFVSVEDIPLFHFWSGHPSVLWKAFEGCSLLTGDDANLLGRQSIAIARQSGCRIITVDMTRRPAESSFFETFFHTVGDAGLETAIKIGAGDLRRALRLKGSTAPSALCLVWSGPGDAETHDPSTPDGDDSSDLEQLLQKRGSTHVELVTPIDSLGHVNSVLGDLAHRIAACDPAIPWHLVRLGHQGEGRDGAADLTAFLRKVRRALDHVYLENLPLSRWLDTICPDCGTQCTDRIAMRKGRCLLACHRLDSGGNCPVCGRDLGFKGDIAPPGLLPVEQRDPRTGFISFEKWEVAVNLGSGRPQGDAVINPMYGPARERPFPAKIGDTDEWVFDMAIETIARHKPNLLVLHTASLVDPTTAGSDAAQDAAAKKIEDLIGHLISKTAYRPLVLGLGAPSLEDPVAAPIDKGVVVADERIACCHGGQLLRQALAETSGIERILSRTKMSEILEAPLDPNLYSDTFAIAVPGRGFTSTLARPEGPLLPIIRDGDLPIWHEGAPIDGIWSLRRAIASRVIDGENLALILVEGLGFDSFGFSDQKIRCHRQALPVSTSMILSQVSAGRIRVPFDFIPAPWGIRTLSNPLALGAPFDNDSVTFDIMNRRKLVAVISNRSGRLHRIFPGHLCIEPLPATRDTTATLIACP